MDVDYHDEEDGDRTINGVERLLGGDATGMEEEEEGDEGDGDGEEQEEEEEFWGGEERREKDLVSPELLLALDFMGGREGSEEMSEEPTRLVR